MLEKRKELGNFSHVLPKSPSANQIHSFLSPCRVTCACILSYRDIRRRLCSLTSTSFLDNQCCPFFVHKVMALLHLAPVDPVLHSYGFGICSFQCLVCSSKQFSFVIKTILPCLQRHKPHSGPSRFKSQQEHICWLN